MTIRDMVHHYLLADGTVAGFIGTRLYPKRRQQKQIYPAGILFLVDDEREPSLHAIAGRSEARLQIDLWCDTNGAAALGYTGSQAVVDDIGAAVRRRLDGFGWKVGADLYLTDTSTSPETLVRAWIRFDQQVGVPDDPDDGGLSRHTSDYMVEFQTHGGTY